MVPARDAPAEHAITVPVASSDPVSGEAATIELGFVRLSTLYRGFFGDPRMVGPLGTELGVCIAGSAPVRVEWDQTKLQGRIALAASPGAGCLPQAGAESVDLAPLRPVGEALAHYRDAVAGAFDLRVSSFIVEVELGSPEGQHCALRLAGQHPPDGSTWSRCVRAGDVETCDPGPATEGTVELRGPASQLLRGCLAS